MQITHSPGVTRPFVNVTKIAPGFKFSAILDIFNMSESSKQVEFAKITSPSVQLNSRIEPYGNVGYKVESNVRYQEVSV